MKITTELAQDLGLIDRRPEAKHFLVYMGLFCTDKF